MLIENNTLVEIDQEDVIDGVFKAPEEVLYIGDNLYCNTVVKMILPNVVEIGNDFLVGNKSLEFLEIPKVNKIGDCFLMWNKVLKSLHMPNVKEIGAWFLFNNTNFNFTPEIIKAFKGDMYINYRLIDKNKYLRKLKIKKLFCK